MKKVAFAPWRASSSSSRGVCSGSGPSSKVSAISRSSVATAKVEP